VEVRPRQGPHRRGKSFALELPPYWQDLATRQAGSDGYFFINSFNTEMATGGIEKGNPPFEAGASKRDMDYLHIIDWKKAEAAFKAGKAKMINGFPVISWTRAVAEGILYFAPEPKSPHGVDVTPDGEYMVVAGKLDPHVTVYSIDKIKAADRRHKKYSRTDEYGVPVLDFDAVKEAQVELGLGPLHTQFDDKGYAYTSRSSSTRRWPAGRSAAYAKLTGAALEAGHQDARAVQHRPPVRRRGRHGQPGRQLPDLDEQVVGGPLPARARCCRRTSSCSTSRGTGTTMPVIYDMPIGVGEPHYCQMIKADKLKSWKSTPRSAGTRTRSRRPQRAQEGRGGRRARRQQGDVNMTAIRSHFTPEHVEIKRATTSPGASPTIETRPGRDARLLHRRVQHQPLARARRVHRVRVHADKARHVPYYCTEFCSALHLEMMGYLHV
jgi:nitrous-oxide reductase